jgi:WD40 repeat protein
LPLPAGTGRVWLWDVSARRALGPPLTGHADVVDALSFAPDGRTLASAGADHTLRLWDVDSHQPLSGPLDTAGGWVSALAFGPRGDQLASAGEDGTVRLWDPILWSQDRAALERRICGTIRRNLSRAEWNEFLPGRPYHRTCSAY